MTVPPITFSPRQKIEEILRILRGRVNHQENIDCSVVDVADTGTANVEFTVDHRLGRVPIGYVWNIGSAGIIYDSNKSSWTSTQLTLKCSAANAVVRLIVY